jgi:MFS family permease
MKTSQKKAAIGFIFITLLIDITGWGIIIPVVPDLIKELIHADISEAAKYGGWLGFAYAFTQFVFSPVVGNLSDQYGRRPIILLSLLVLLLIIFFWHFHLILFGCLLVELLQELLGQVSPQQVLILQIFLQMKIEQRISD